MCAPLDKTAEGKLISVTAEEAKVPFQTKVAGVLSIV